MHWDMEGASGLFKRSQTWYWEDGVSEEDAEEGKRLLTDDVNSAALEGGATQIVACDAHHGGGNLQVDRLSSDSRFTWYHHTVDYDDGTRRWHSS